MKIQDWAKKNTYSIAVTIICTILIIVFLEQCSRTNSIKKELSISEQNIRALNDSLRQTTTKDNKPEFDQLSFLVQDVKALKELNMELAKEVMNTKGRVNYIAKLGAKVVHDTTYLEAEVFMDEDSEKLVLDFHKDTVYSTGNSRSIAGYTEYDPETGETIAAITRDSMNISFITGLKNLDKGKPEIFIRSNYPGFSASSIEGAFLDPTLFKPKNKQKLITLGLNIGYTPITYSFSKQKVSVDPFQFGASIGLNFNLSRLLGK